MPNKQIAVGARTKVLMDVETSYGVAPTTPGGVLLPINSFSLKPSRAKNTPGTLTGRYDPAEPFDGNLEVSGGVVVPVDARAFGHWLRAMFGAPATTGTGEPAAAPFTHVWKSNKDMPSLVMQATYGDIYGQFVGCKVSSLAMQAGGDGELTATVNMLGRDADYVDADYNAGAPSVAMKRFNNFQGSLLSGGAEIGVVTDCSLNIDFGLDSSIRKLGDKGRVYDLPQGVMAVTGSLTVFITDKTLLMKAKNSEELSLDLSFAIDEGNKLTFSVPEVQLSYDGPRGSRWSRVFRRTSTTTRTTPLSSLLSSMTWNPINQQTQKENTMRTVTLSGQDFIVNPLKGKDIKALKAQGFDLMGGGYSISEGMDAVFTVAGFDAAQTDELPFPDILALHKAIVNETFGVAEEEKN